MQIFVMSFQNWANNKQPKNVGYVVCQLNTREALQSSWKWSILDLGIMCKVVTKHCANGFNPIKLSIKWCPILQMFHPNYDMSTPIWTYLLSAPKWRSNYNWPTPFIFISSMMARGLFLSTSFLFSCHGLFLQLLF
jgi:hypothetical protein